MCLVLSRTVLTIRLFSRSLPPTGRSAVLEPVPSLTVLATCLLSRFFPPTSRSAVLEPFRELPVRCHREIFPSPRLHLPCLVTGRVWLAAVRLWQVVGPLWVCTPRVFVSHLLLPLALTQTQFGSLPPNLFLVRGQTLGLRAWVALCPRILAGPTAFRQCPASLLRGNLYSLRLPRFQPHLGIVVTNPPPLQAGLGPLPPATSSCFLSGGGFPF